MNIGPLEIVLIVILALILYGKRLPEITKALGKGYGEFKKSIDSVKREIQEQVENISSEKDNAKTEKGLCDSSPVRDEKQDYQLPLTTSSEEESSPARRDSENKNLAG
ncbi:MAG: twin-arginine translocase TatA/TatE family subunit [Planctomycetota bacterium]|nr:twin-arginine translocase TatA/TatE family subunit [Planctomycetota bacterium]